MLEMKVLVIYMVFFKTHAVRYDLLFTNSRRTILTPLLNINGLPITPNFKLVCAAGSQDIENQCGKLAKSLSFNEQNTLHFD